MVQAFSCRIGQLTVYFYYVDKDIVTYKQIVENSIKQGRNPYVGLHIVEAVSLFLNGKNTLQTGNCFIIGLDEKEKLEKSIYPCGTILYYYPILFTSNLGNMSIQKSCFSESGVIDNFSNCYVLAL